MRSDSKQRMFFLSFFLFLSPSPVCAAVSRFQWFCQPGGAGRVATLDNSWSATGESITSKTFNPTGAKRAGSCGGPWGRRGPLSLRISVLQHDRPDARAAVLKKNLKRRGSVHDKVIIDWYS